MLMLMFSYTYFFLILMILNIDLYLHTTVSQVMVNINQVIFNIIYMKLLHYINREQSVLNFFYM